MIRLFNAYFPIRTLLLAVSEAFLIALAMMTSIYARFGPDSSLVLLYESGLIKIGVVAGVCLVCMYYYDMYDSLVLSSMREVMTRLIQVLGTACLLMAVIYYVDPFIQLSVGVFLTGIVFIGVVLVLWRRLFASLTRTPRLAERVLLIGQDPLGASLASAIEKRPELGLRLLGYISSAPALESGMNGLPRLGAPDDLPRVVDHERIHRILVTMGDRRGKLPVAELLRLKTSGVRVDDGSDFYEMVTGKVPLESLRPSWLLFSSGFRVSQGMMFTKRIISAVLAALSLLVSLPLMGLIAVAIWLDSGSPVLFRQRRVGQNGKVFTLYKFRSMRDAVANADEFKPAEENDDRFTRVGRWIRRARLDELPQLFNILKGDMHFVGPRPFALEEEQALAEQIPFYRQRWVVRPGATGWAQIQRGYCATMEDNIDKLGYDLFYIKNMSVGLDLLIVLRTIKILLLGRGAR